MVTIIITADVFGHGAKRVEANLRTSPPISSNVFVSKEFYYQNAIYDFVRRLKQSN